MFLCFLFANFIVFNYYVSVQVKSGWLSSAIASIPSYVSVSIASRIPTLSIWSVARQSVWSGSGSVFDVIVSSYHEVTGSFQASAAAWGIPGQDTWPQSI